MNKKETWRWIINLIVSVLTAIVTALGTTSCIQQVAPTSYPSYIQTAEPGCNGDDLQDVRIVIKDSEEE